MDHRYSSTWRYESGRKREKTEKYQDLAREVGRLRKTSTTAVIPIVVGALGLVARFENYRGILNMQKREVLCSTRISKNV